MLLEQKISRLWEALQDTENNPPSAPPFQANNLQRRRRQGFHYCEPKCIRVDKTPNDRWLVTAFNRNRGPQIGYAIQAEYIRNSSERGDKDRFINGMVSNPNESHFHADDYIQNDTISRELCTLIDDFFSHYLPETSG